MNDNLDWYFYDDKEIEKRKKKIVEKKGEIICELSGLFDHLNDENKNLESEQNHINNKEYNEISDLKHDLESLKLKNTLVKPFYPSFIHNHAKEDKTIMAIRNGGANIYIDKLIDENYDLKKTIDNLKHKIDEVKNNIINIYFNEGYGFTKVFRYCTCKEIMESLKLKYNLEEKLINIINQKKIIDLKFILNIILEQLFVEKLNNIHYKIENLKMINSKRKEILILKNNMKIRNL